MRIYGNKLETVFGMTGPKPKSATLVQCIWTINFSRVEWENKRKIVDKEDGIIPRNQLFTNQKRKINENKKYESSEWEKKRDGGER